MSEGNTRTTEVLDILFGRSWLTNKTMCSQVWTSHSICCLLHRGKERVSYMEGHCGSDRRTAGQMGRTVENVTAGDIKIQRQWG